MSLSDILGSALSGLNAAQAGLRSASSNIANVSTPGYARERVATTPGVTAGRLNGVRVSEPERVADRFLESNVTRRSGEAGRAGIIASTLDRLQALLGSPSSGGNLSARIDAVSAAAIAMTGSTATEQTARAFTASLQDALGTVHQLGSDISALRADVATDVRSTVDRINGLIGRIGDLNESVARLAAAGRSTSGANGQRMSAVEELGGLLQLTVREQPDGRLQIDTANGITLVDRRPRQLNFPAGDQVDQPAYPAIAVHFAEFDGRAGALTGDALDSAAVGGKLGGLLQLRDATLPAFADELGAVLGGLVESINGASNAGTAVPAPRVLTGGSTGLIESDRLGFSGRTTFAVVQPDGRLIANTTLDLSTLGPGTTVADAVAAINSGLGGAATASFVNGRLTLAAGGTNGMVIADDPLAPSQRAGVGFSHFFGLNDLVTSPSGSLLSAGLAQSDPHGFAIGQSVELVLRDTSGRTLASQVLSPSAGGTVGDLLNELNAGPLGALGSFALDSRGRLQFAADAAIPGAMLGVPADTTDRFGTGRTFTSLFGLPRSPGKNRLVAVRSDLLASPQGLPLARFDAAASPSQVALGPGDTRNAITFADRLAAQLDLGPETSRSIGQLAASLVGRAGADAAHSREAVADADARLEDAVVRRDNFSGVNVDEELALLVTLQNSYSAAARVMTTATQMYDTLLGMVR